MIGIDCLIQMFSVMIGGCCRDSLPNGGGVMGGASMAKQGCCRDSLPNRGGVMGGASMAIQGCSRDSLPNRSG